MDIVNDNKFKAFFVGLMDGNGNIQVNHWRHKSLQFRLVIKLKLTDANQFMLIKLAKVVGGYVKSNGGFILWIETDRIRIQKLLYIYDLFPPITSRLSSQLKFMRNCLTHLSVEEYMATRD